jgi:hypothetical protein
MENAKSVWISKQDIFKILQPYWTSDCRRSYFSVQRKSHFPTIHNQETQTFLHQNLKTMWRDWIHVRDMTLYSVLNGSEEISYRDSRFILLNYMLEIMAQDGRQEYHSTKFGMSRSVTVTQPKCQMWLRVVGREKCLVKCGVSKMCVCVCCVCV